MNFQKELTTKIKPELNNLYVVKPNLEIGDMGWYCREHALHLFVVGQLFGYKSEICLGDFLIRNQDYYPDDIYTSIGSVDDHAWCSINNVSPVDISLTLKHVYSSSPDIPIVYGTKNDSGDQYKILSLGDESADKVYEIVEKNPYLIIYLHKETLGINPLELLNNPWEFLHSPPSGCPKMTETHGEDIFFRITDHCYKLIKGQSKPLFTYRDAKGALAAIIKRNQDTKDQVLERLKTAY